MDKIDPLTTLINAAQAGDRQAADAVLGVVYDELKRLAHGIRRRGGGETVNTTALVHEAWLKLAQAQGISVENRQHFKHLVAQAMRQVLFDGARARAAQKRGAGLQAVTLDEAIGGQSEVDPTSIIELHGALLDLEETTPRAAAVVECRFFGGMDVKETALALGISTATVKRDWRFARAWLVRALAD